jgi:hypothetical protein
LQQYKNYRPSWTSSFRKCIRTHIHQRCKLLQMFPLNQICFSDVLTSFLKYTKVCGDFFKVRVGPFHRMLLMSNHQILEHVLGDRKFLKKSDKYKFLKPWLGSGLLTSEGENHNLDLFFKQYSRRDMEETSTPFDASFPLRDFARVRTSFRKVWRHPRRKISK